MATRTEFTWRNARSTVLKYDVLYPQYGGKTIITQPLTESLPHVTERTVITVPQSSSGYSSLLSHRYPLPVNPYKKTVRDIGLSWYVGVYRKVVNGGVAQSITERTGTTVSVGYDIPLSSLGITGQLAAQDNKAAVKLLDKIKSGRVNLAQVVAERSQTARLVGDTAIKIANSLRALKKGDIVSAARALGSAKPSRAVRRRTAKQFRVAGPTADFTSRSWLELQYGWKPLLTDVFGAAQALAELPYGASYNKVEAGSTFTTHSELSGIALSTDSKLLGSGAVTYTRTVRYGCSFSADPLGKPLAALGLTNPALIAWELLPFSFVVDWFLPVGNYISSLDATIGCQFIDGYRSEKVTVTSVSDTKSNGYADEYFLSRRTFKEMTFERTRLLAFPSPRLPSWKNPVSTTHALNALALLKQIAGGSRR